ncbi:MAG: hypothetical protein Q8N69_00540 [bacterium]|nr:hypothetical protein [bacterium]
MRERFWHNSSCFEGDGTESQFFNGAPKISPAEALVLREKVMADRVLQELKKKRSLLDSFGLTVQSNQILVQIIERERTLIADVGFCPEKVGYCLFPEGFPIDLYWTDDGGIPYGGELPSYVLQLMEKVKLLIDLGLFHSFRIWERKEEKDEWILVGKFFGEKYLLVRWGKKLEPIFLSVPEEIKETTT